RAPLGRAGQQQRQADRHPTQRQQTSDHPALPPQVVVAIRTGGVYPIRVRTANAAGSSQTAGPSPDQGSRLAGWEAPRPVTPRGQTTSMTVASRGRTRVVPVTARPPPGAQRSRDGPCGKGGNGGPGAA